MTSVPPAEPRPPPLRPPDLQRSRTSSLSGFDLLTGQSPIESGVSRLSEGQDADERPLKRRKIDQSFGADAGIVSQSPTSGEPPNQQRKTVVIQDLRLLSARLASQGQEEVKPEDATIPPLPTRPWKHAKPVVGLEDAKPTHRIRIIQEVPMSPDTSHDVVTAPPLGIRSAGYFPWTGTHLEDVLSEGNVKQGYYDRPPNPPERELSSARVTLYNPLKHKSGIESLSTLFSAVLNAKNKTGLISSASTFKPPPRVTLAEAKRKSWIADLSDPNVPLRRLSRTIPQGIRGQGLLDQCIQHGVPLSRAVWFAKCVGANEIRTLKRKGTTLAAAVGTETKWLREWTVNVEQFLETLLSHCGQSGWKGNVQYAIRLTTRLYLENLVDRDHYIDWIVKSFSTCDTERLPFWLMIIHIYKSDIANYRKWARLLVETLIGKYQTMRESNDDVVQSLVVRLRTLIRDFALNRPQCFISPDGWLHIRKLLESCLESDNPSEKLLMQRLHQANETCAGANRQQFSNTQDAADTVVDILDSASPPYDPNALSDRLFTACSDFNSLITSCLEWATTKFRCRSSRIYLVARLVRKWDRGGHEIESSLLNFVARCHNKSFSFDPDAMKHLVAELSRSHTFPTSQYLQYLNVRGLPRPGTFSSVDETNVQAEQVGSAVRQKCFDRSQILVDVSLHNLKSHLIHQRNALLARAGYFPDLEASSVEDIQSLLRIVLSSSQAEIHDLIASTTLIEMLLDWDWTVRAQISHWLRAFVAEKVKQRDVNHPLQADHVFTIRHFEVVRHALEILNDESVLADVIGICSTLDDERLQASLVETVTRHADAFSAIGALHPLQTKFNQIYMTLRSSKPTMPLLATALLDLFTGFPHKSASTRLLRQDLVKGDRGRAIAACSPFSDGIAESLQQAEATFIDDFEAVLQSEPNMNEQTMARLSSVLIERIDKLSHVDDEHALFTYCQLMARLRHCRPQQGDQLIKTWLGKAFSSAPAEFVKNLTYSMIGSGGLTITTLIQSVSVSGQASSKVVDILPEHSVGKHSCHYSVRTKWERFARRQPLEVINLISENGNTSHHSLDEKTLCADFLLHHFNALSQLLQSSVNLLDEILTDLVTEGDGAESDLKATIRISDTFSLRFVQARLSLLNRTRPHMEQDVIASAIKDSVFDNRADRLDSRHFPTLLEGLGSGIGTSVRHLAEEHVLDILPKLHPGKASEDEPFDLEEAKTAVDQAFQICLAPSHSPSKSISQLVEKLSQLVKSLGNINIVPSSPVKASASSPTSAVLPSIASQLFAASNPSSPLDSTYPRPHQPSIIAYFRLLLQLLCLVRPSATSSANTVPQPTTPTSKQPPPPAQRSQSDQIKILVFLATLITHPFLTSPKSFFTDNPTVAPEAAETLSFAYDVMATYADDLSDDARALVAKILKDKLASSSSTSSSIASPTTTSLHQSAASKLRYLFGSVALCGSQLNGAEEMGKGLIVLKKGEDKGEWKPRVWEVLGSGGSGGAGGGGAGGGGGGGGGVRDGETSLGLGLFGARR